MSTTPPLSVSNRRRLTAGLAAAALIGGLAPLALTTQPVAAVSGSLNYQCTVPYFGAVTLPMVFDTDLAQKVYVGAKPTINTTARITLPSELVRSFAEDGYTGVGGSLKLNATSGTTALTSNFTLPSATLPKIATPTPTPSVTSSVSTSPSQSPTPSSSSTASTLVSASPTVTSTATPTATQKPTTSSTPAAAAQVVAPITIEAKSKLTTIPTTATGDQVLKAGSVNITLSLKMADGSALSLPNFTCNVGSGVDTTFDTSAVATKSTLTLAGPSTAVAGTSVRLTATVTAKAGSTEGQVRFTVGQLVFLASVVSGVATYDLPTNVPAGSYPVTVQFLPTDSAHVDPATATRTMLITAPPVVTPAPVIVKEPTTTAVSLGKSRGTLAVKVSVKSVKGLAASGTAQVTLKRRGKTVKSVALSLSGGTASTRFTGLRKGRYQVAVRYAGATAFAPSSASRKVGVRR